MQKSQLGLLVFLVFLGSATASFDLSIEKPSGTYYRFWFIYALISSVMTVILVIATFVSMCRRYKLVASQDEEKDHHAQRPDPVVLLLRIVRHR
ncbi:unnamed protein product [Caenorhabditis brenneri]